MRAIRPALSASLIVVMILLSEGLAVSLHWCCGTVESLTVNTVTECCCCQEGESASDLTFDQTGTCCQTATTYLLLPIGSLRTEECLSLLGLSHALALPLLALSSTAGTTVLEMLPAALTIQTHAILPLLQRFRL